MIKALVIAPYEGLFNLMTEIEKELTDFQLQIEQGDLHEGLAIARDAKAKGFDVIISRGGTASMIQEVVDIPVVDIQVSGYDVLRILTLVKSFSGKAAIVGFSNISNGASTICRLLDLKIDTITIMSDTEVEETLNKLKTDGYEVVIGDVVTVRVAKQLGIHGILITSGKEAVIEAMNEARRIFQVFNRLKMDVSLYQSIINADEKPIFVMNQMGEVVFHNSTFLDEFHRSIVQNSKDLKTLIKNASLTKSEQSSLLFLNETFWQAIVRPFEDLVIVSLRRENYNFSKNADSLVVEFKTSLPHVLIAGKSEHTQKLIQQIEISSERDDSIWITSENGNGKELISHSIYLKRNEPNPFIEIHCDLVTKDYLQKIVNEGFFEIYRNSTIYLRQIDRLDHPSQMLLYSLLQTIKEQGPKWITSSSEQIINLVDQGLFHRDLYYSLSQYMIYFPPLRERKEDIENLVQLFISDAHSKYGKQIVGIRNDALEELMEYDWPGNVEELKRLIDQMVLESNSFYIEKQQVSFSLDHVRKTKREFDQKKNISIKGTLEEIEKKIIEMVLSEEDMNQSRAAKRLGINRSTLWRKLK
jgi:transcriptional regulator with PAS, ATPase and Fis domain